MEDRVRLGADDHEARHVVRRRDVADVVPALTVGLLRGDERLLVDLRVRRDDVRRRRTGYAVRRSFLLLGVDARLVRRVRHAALEGVRVESEGLGVLDELRHRIAHRRPDGLVLEEQVVHLPVLALSARALGRVRAVLGVRVDLVERELLVDERGLARVEVVRRQARLDVREPALAEGALVVRVLDDLHRCVRVLAAHVLAAHVERDLLRRRGVRRLLRRLRGPCRTVRAVERGVDRRLEDVERLRARYHLTVDEERGCSAHAGLRSLVEVVLHVLRVLAGRVALPERRVVESDLLGELDELVRRIGEAHPLGLVAEELVVVREELALIAGAQRGLGRVLGVLVDREREVLVDELDLAGLDVLVVECRFGVREEPFTVRALEVRVLDHRHRSVLRALRVRAVEVELLADLHVPAAERRDAQRAPVLEPAREQGDDEQDRENDRSDDPRVLVRRGRGIAGDVRDLRGLGLGSRCSLRLVLGALLVLMLDSIARALPVIGFLVRTLRDLVLGGLVFLGTRPGGLRLVTRFCLVLVI